MRKYEQKAIDYLAENGQAMERIGGTMYAVRYPLTASRAMFSRCTEELVMKLESAMKREARGRS
jgi:hypothetical protein